MSINPLSELHELAQAVIAPINNINFHSWMQTTKPGNQIVWKGQLSVQFLDHDVPDKNETVTVEAEGPKKKAVQQELARKMLEKFSEAFKRPDNCKLYRTCRFLKICGVVWLTCSFRCAGIFSPYRNCAQAPERTTRNANGCDTL
jgi:hypothetical protein